MPAYIRFLNDANNNITTPPSGYTAFYASSASTNCREYEFYLKDASGAVRPVGYNSVFCSGGTFTQPVTFTSGITITGINGITATTVSATTMAIGTGGLDTIHITSNSISGCTSSGVLHFSLYSGCSSDIEMRSRLSHNFVSDTSNTSSVRIGGFGDDLGSGAKVLVSADTRPVFSGITNNTHPLQLKRSSTPGNIGIFLNTALSAAGVTNDSYPRAEITVNANNKSLVTTLSNGISQFIIESGATDNHLVLSGSSKFGGRENQILITDDSNTHLISDWAACGIQSTTQGFLPPRLTTAQISTLAGNLGNVSEDNGMMVYNTTTNVMQVWTGATPWMQIGTSLN